MNTALNDFFPFGSSRNDTTSSRVVGSGRQYADIVMLSKKVERPGSIPGNGVTCANLGMMSTTDQQSNSFQLANSGSGGQCVMLSEKDSLIGSHTSETNTRVPGNASPRKIQHTLNPISSVSLPGISSVVLPGHQSPAMALTPISDLLMVGNARSTVLGAPPMRMDTDVSSGLSPLLDRRSDLPSFPASAQMTNSVLQKGALSYEERLLYGLASSSFVKGRRTAMKDIYFSEDE